MSWSDLKVESSGKFLKIEGGSFTDIHILDEHPKKELIHGFGADKVSCGEGCHLCDDPSLPEEMKQKERWKTNVLDRRDGKVKIFEFGPSVAMQIRDISKMLAEVDQTVHNVDFRISASSGKPKRYNVIQKPMNMAVPPNLKLWPL